MDSFIAKKVCGLCNNPDKCDDLGSLYPEYFKIEKEIIYVSFHFLCKRWAGELWNVTDNEMKKSCLLKAYLRGRKMKCSLCKKVGATVGCARKGCNKNFHYLCAVKARSVFHENPDLHFCEKHRKYLDITLADNKKQNENNSKSNEIDEDDEKTNFLETSDTEEDNDIDDNEDESEDEKRVKKNIIKEEKMKKESTSKKVEEEEEEDDDDDDDDKSELISSAIEEENDEENIDTENEMNDEGDKSSENSSKENSKEEEEEDSDYKVIQKKRKRKRIDSDDVNENQKDNRIDDSIKQNKKRKIYTAKRSLGPPIEFNTTIEAVKSDHNGAKVFKIINSIEIPHRLSNPNITTKGIIDNESNDNDEEVRESDNEVDDINANNPNNIEMSNKENNNSDNYIQSKVKKSDNNTSMQTSSSYLSHSPFSQHNSLSNNNNERNENVKEYRILLSPSESSNSYINNNNNNNKCSILPVNIVIDMNNKVVDIQKNNYNNSLPINIEKEAVPLIGRDVVQLLLTDRMLYMFPLYFVSLYGIGICIDILRESSGKEIIIQKHIKRKDFLVELNKMSISKLLLMKLYYYKYVREGELCKYLSELSKEDSVSVFECEEYVLYIIPNDNNIYNYGLFGFVVERYERNGELIPGWCIIYLKR